MSEFEVKVVRINQPVENHPNADRLSIVKIGGYECISAKNEDGSHRYQEGELVVYVPEAAIVSEWALKHYGFWDETKDRGMLTGPNYDRVKAVKLRGVVSQGLLFKLGNGPWGTTLQINDTTNAFVSENMDVAEMLGIVKYEPPIPASLSGSVTRIPHPGTVNLPGGIIYRYDFENIQKVTDMFEEGEAVYVNEKIHGTFCQIGYIPGLNHVEGFGDWFVTSKGLGKQGLCFQNLDDNTSNVYVKVLKSLINSGITEKFEKFSRDRGNESIRIFGEIYGNGIQDLTYGLDKPEFRVFDTLFGDDEFAGPVGLSVFCEDMGLEFIKPLAFGTYSKEFLLQYRDGKSTMGGDHMREGIVIRSVNGDKHPRYGRKIAKFVSPDYLLRKNGTEFN